MARRYFFNDLLGADFVPAARPPRVLAARPSRERSPPPRAASLTPSAQTSASATAAAARGFALGAEVVLVGLVSRPELTGKTGVFLSFDDESQRFAVRIAESGATVRVLEKKLKLPRVH